MSDVPAQTTIPGVLAPIGHNKPPSTFEIVKSSLAETYAHLPTRARALINAAESLDEPITNDEDEKLLTDQGTQIRDVISEWEKLRKVEKDAYLQGGRAVDTFFGDENIKPLNAALDKLRARLSKWKSAKEQKEIARREAEERERREAAEAAAKAAAEAAAKMQSEQELEQAVSAEEYAKTLIADAEAAARGVTAPVETKVHGEYGGRSSGVKKWKLVDFDRQKLDLNTLRDHFSDDELRKALNRYIAAGGRTINGAKIDLVMTTRF